MTGVSAYSQRPSARDTEALVMRHAELVKRIAYHLAGRLPASVEVDDLIQACRRLREENHTLRASRESLLQERTALAEKNRLARHRLEQIIDRLRSLEEQAETRQ